MCLATIKLESLHDVWKVEHLTEQALAGSHLPQPLFHGVTQCFACLIMLAVTHLLSINEPVNVKVKFMFFLYGKNSDIE